MTTVQIHKTFYSCPQTWDELTARQLRKLVVILYSDMNLVDARVNLFKILTGAGWLAMWRHPDQVDDKLYLVDFLFEDNTLTKNIFP